MIILANPRSDWNVLRPLLFESIGQTLTMVLVTLVIGGFLGLILGVAVSYTHLDVYKRQRQPRPLLTITSRCV